MAKEFKTFDKEYAYLAGTALKTLLGLTYPDGHKTEIQAIEGWAHVDEFTESYDRHEIAHAVYGGIDAIHWQKFRVSLKGLNTKEKLFCLQWYWDEHITQWNGTRPPFVRNEIIRLNNYLGALKRAGCLDQQLHVIKL